MSHQELRKILVPIDGSEYSFRAASHAIRLAKNFDAELLLLHVAAVNQRLQMVGLYGGSAPKSISERVGDEEYEAAVWFEQVEKEAKVRGISITKEVIEGPLSTVGEIVQYAEHQKVDLIVIGSRGRTGFKKLILGSVASGVATYATCAVLVVK